VVSGIMSRRVSPVMRLIGVYVLGGAKRCPQLSGPLFTGLAAVAGPGGDGEERVGQHGQRDVPVPGRVGVSWHWSRPVSFLASAKQSFTAQHAPATAASSARDAPRAA
jgi:hypothetical protein